jgi:hypothetical protein
LQRKLGPRQLATDLPSTQPTGRLRSPQHLVAPDSRRFDSARGLEVIGTLANLLNRGGIHAAFVESFETAILESRQYLDAFFQNDYACAEAYSCHEKWCDWFIGEGMLDETVLVRNRDEWWLLTVTDTD